MARPGVRYILKDLKSGDVSRERPRKDGVPRRPRTAHLLRWHLVDITPG